MTIGNPYKVTKKIKLHTNPLVEAKIVESGVFKKETSKIYIFDGFKVNKANVTMIEEVDE
jgi:hypothetical protein